MSFPKQWKTTEQVFLVGDTGTGKTTLEAGTRAYPGLLMLRDFVISIRTKGDPLVFPGFVTITSVSQIKHLDPAVPTRYMLDLTRAAAKRSLGSRIMTKESPTTRAAWRGHQFREITKCLDFVWRSSSKPGIPWCVNFDEQFYVEKVLGMKDDATDTATQWRSQGLTPVFGAQRLSWITKFILGSATHIFIFRQSKNDINIWKRDLDTNAGNALAQVKGHDFLYYHRPTGEMIIGNLQSLPNVLTK
jgi:hypothetical protein